MKLTLVSLALVAMTSFSAFALVNPEDFSKDVILDRPFSITELGSLPEIQESSEKKCLDFMGEVISSSNKHPGSMSYSCYNGACGERITWEVQCLIKKRTKMPLFTIASEFDFDKQKAILKYSTLNPKRAEYIKNLNDSMYDQNIAAFIELKKDSEIIRLQEELSSKIGPFTIAIAFRYSIDEIDLVNSSYQPLKLNYRVKGKETVIKKETVIEVLNMAIQSFAKEDPFAD